MQTEASRLQEEILTIIRGTLSGRVNVAFIMKTLGARSGDARPRAALDALARQGVLIKQLSTRPHSYVLAEREKSQAQGSSTQPPAVTRPPAAERAAAAEMPAEMPQEEIERMPRAAAVPAAAEITEADVEQRPTDHMTPVASDEALAVLRAKLGTAVDAAASDASAVSAAQQEAITDLIQAHGPQLGSQLVASLGLEREQAVAALRTLVKAGVLTRSGGQGSPFELVQRGVMDLLTGDVLAVCTTCSAEVARGAATPELVRKIFAHDSSHAVRVRADSGSYTRKQLEKIDAEAREAVPKAAPQGPSADQVITCLLPDGRNYAPRTVGDTLTPDVDMLRLCRDNNLPVCLNGPPGTGKTALVLAAFADLLTINGDGDTAVSDLIGTWTMSGDPAQPYVWADGPLTTAMKEGRPLFVDDFTLVSGKVLSVLFPVMDGRGRIYLREHPVTQDDGSFRPEVVEAAKGFWIVGAHNPGVHGAILSPALASRFALHVEVPSDYELAEKMGISRKAVKVARNLQTAAEAGRVGWWPQLRELMAFDKIASILGEDAAIANLAGTCPPEDRPEVLRELKDCFGREVEPLRLGRQLG